MCGVVVSDSYTGIRLGVGKKKRITSGRSFAAKPQSSRSGTGAASFLDDDAGLGDFVVADLGRLAAAGLAEASLFIELLKTLINFELKVVRSGTNFVNDLQKFINFEK